VITIGLVVLLLAAGLTVDAVLENTTSTDVTVLGQTLSGMSEGAVFAAGVAVGVLAMLAVTLVLAGSSRSRRQRAERRQLAREYRGTTRQAETLQQERDRLAKELADERAARAAAERRTVSVAKRGDRADRVAASTGSGRRTETAPVATTTADTSETGAERGTRGIGPWRLARGSRNADTPVEDAEREPAAAATTSGGAPTATEERTGRWARLRQH
jgi:hypothetical protein